MVNERPLPDEERRLVTILFADLVGYTSVSEARDPEIMLDALNLCFKRLSTEIQRFGGYVDKIVGDEIMALFGAPKAQEDDAGKAVAAALAMQDALGELTPQLEKQLGHAFSMRIGINTGLVVTGAVGPGGYTVTGDAVNVAARLETVTEPGTVLVGDATRRLARRPFVWGERQEFEVKGRREAVVCYHAEGLVAAPLRLVPTPSDTPFVGRQQLLSDLHTAWKSAVDGRERVLQLVGESGIGKTRLLAHLFSIVDPKPTQVLYTRADTPPRTFGPLLQLLPSLRDDLPEGFRERIEALSPADDAGGAPQAEPDWLAQGLVEVIAQLSAKGPIAFVLDDMHRADRATVGIVEKLITLLQELPVLFVLVRQPLGRRVRRISDEQTIALQPLSPDEARTLLRTAVAGLREPVTGQIISRAGGNPLYLELLGAAASAAPEGAPIPESLQTAIAARVDELDDTSRRVLREATVFGQSFYEEPLKLTTAVSEGLFEALAHLCEIGLLDDLGDGRHRGYMFRHSLVQEALYQGLLMRQRAELHRRAAEALEIARDEGLDVEPEELAFHYQEAGDAQQAATYHLAAADKADNLRAPVEARSHRRAANQLLNMASLAGLYATNGRPSIGVRVGAAIVQSLIAALLVLPVFLLFATRRPEPNKLTLGLPFEIIDFNASSVLLAVVMGGLPLLLAGIAFAHLAVPVLMKRAASMQTLGLVITGGWVLSIAFVLAGYLALVILLRFGALDDLSSKYVGGATLQILLGNYALLWTVLAGTLVLSICWTILLRLQAKGWSQLRRSSTGPTALARGRRWAAARQAGLLIAGVSALTFVLVLVYQLGILPNGTAQPGLASGTLAGVLLPFAGLTLAGLAGGGFAARKLQPDKRSMQLGFFGFEMPLLLALAFGLVIWFGMRQAVIVSANGVDTPGSLTPFNRAVSMFPDLGTAYYLRGERHLANNNFEGALGDFDKAAELDPSFPATYLARGRVLVQLGEPEAAINDAERLIRLRPEHPGGYAVRAIARATTGDLEGAAADLELATRPLPKNAQAWDAYFVRCLALAAVERLDEAETDCLRVQELNPDHIISLDQLALIAFARAETEPDREQETALYNKGIEYMSRVLRIDPNNAKAWTSRGQAYGFVGQYARDEGILQRSESDLNRALELEPASVRALMNRALTRLYLDRLPEAQADASAAVALYGEEPEDAAAEGVELSEVNATALFIALYAGDYERVISEADALETGGFSTVWVLSNRGLAEVELGDFDRGLADINRALALESDAALAFDRRGYAYLRLGDFDRAETDLNEAARLASLLDPQEQAELSYHRALLLRELGRTDLAAAELQQASERAEVPSVRRQIDQLQELLGDDATSP